MNHESNCPVLGTSGRRDFLKQFAKAVAAVAATSAIPLGAWASDKSPVWKSSKKAAKFLKDIISIDSLNANLSLTASRPEIWDEYYTRALKAGITAFGVTTGQGIMTFDEVVMAALEGTGTITVKGNFDTLPESWGGKKYRGAAIGGPTWSRPGPTRRARAGGILD